jgi:hypothetical protein
MQGKFNSFQKTMLQWDEMHPYNAVHVVRIPGPLDIAKLQQSLKAGLEQSGLGGFRFDRERGAYAYQSDSPSCEARIITGNAGAQAELQAEVEQQLNTSFALKAGFTPFRFFALAATDSFFLGLAYFHAVADAESIVFLLRHLVRCYLKPGHTAVPNLNRYPDGRGHLLRRHLAVVLRKLLTLPGQVRRLRQSSRPRYRDTANFKNGFQFITVKRERWKTLLAAAEDWGVTVNDLLLALLLKSVSPLAAGRQKAKKRRKISVGCIVNLRRELAIDSVGVFGVFLGSFIVTHAMADDVSLRGLAGDIREQTLAIKRGRLFLATPMELGLGRFCFRFFSTERRRKFYQKHYPLWGGLTNMNLNALWEQSDHDGPQDYFRGVSTGPVTPLVFSVTTVGDHANIGVSYRTTVFSPEDIEAVRGAFHQEIERLAAGV